MPQPTTIVEIAFDAGVSGTPTWGDVTNRVRVQPGISITHWRGDEDSQCQPSTCSLTLRNDDGRYTPGNADSPLYPNIKKGRRIRVRSLLNGVYYPRFTGYISDWQVDWPGKVGWIADCQVTAASRMAVLGRGAELRSVVEEEILASGPLAYYTLGDPVGTSSASDSSGNGRSPLLAKGGAVTFGTDGGPEFDGLTAALFAGGYLETSDNYPATGEWSLECFFSRAAFTGEESLMRVNFRGLSIATTPVGSIPVVPDTYADGELHHAALTQDSGGNYELFVDGTSIDTGSTALPDTDGPLLLGSSGPPADFAGTLAHFAFYDYVLDPLEIANHAEAGLSGLPETSGARLERYAAFAAVTLTETDFDTGRAALAHIDTSGATALDAMRQVEVTEGGVLFDGLDGTLRFHDRARRYSPAAFGSGVFGAGLFGGSADGSDFTLSYTAGDVANPLRPVLDDQQQVNDMTNTNADGVTGRQFDQDSIDDHGLYRTGLSLATTDPDEPLLRASWTVGRYAEPLTRVSSVEVLLNNLNDYLTAEVLAAEVGTMFTLSDLPDNAPSASMNLFVEGRTETITGDEDRITLRTSPAEVWEVFTLGDPVKGVLGSEYPLAY